MSTGCNVSIQTRCLTCSHTFSGWQHVRISKEARVDHWSWTNVNAYSCQVKSKTWRDTRGDTFSRHVVTVGAGCRCTNLLTIVGTVVSPGVWWTFSDRICDANFSDFVAPCVGRAPWYTSSVGVLLCECTVRTCLYTHVSNSVAKSYFSKWTSINTRLGWVFSKSKSSGTIYDALTSFENRTVSIVNVWASHDTSLGHINISVCHWWSLGTVKNTNTWVIFGITICRAWSWLNTSVSHIFSKSSDRFCWTSWYTKTILFLGKWSINAASRQTLSGRILSKVGIVADWDA